jgi:hypothetical protein
MGGPPELVCDRLGRPEQERPAVYNMEILDGPPAFFASGLLVHNCLDVPGYLVMAGPLAPATDRPRHQESFKERALRAALKRIAMPTIADLGFRPGISP